MHRKTPVLPFSATVPEAIEFLKQNPEGFAAVQASPERLHGVLTEGPLMQIFLRYQAHPERETLILHRDLFEPAQLTHEDEFLPEIVKKVVTAVGNRVFVINTLGAVIGYITAKDVLPYFSPTGPSAGEDKKPMDNLKSDLYLFETFFSKSPFMMHSVNREGVIRMANEIMHTVLGYDYGELIGKTIFDLYPASAHTKAEAGIKTIFSKGYHKVVQGTMVHKENKKIEVELVSRALMNQYSETIGTMTVSRPIDMKYLLDCLPHLG